MLITSYYSYTNDFEFMILAKRVRTININYINIMIYIIIYRRDNLPNSTLHVTIIMM